jgi:hypothetical protein
MRGANLFVAHQRKEGGGELFGRAIGPQEFGNQRPIEQQIDQVGVADLHGMGEDPLGQPIEAVADDHRQPGPGEFERDRARGGQRRAAGGKAVIFLIRPAHDNRLSRPGADRLPDRRGDGGDRRHDDAEPAERRLGQRQCAAKDRQQPFDLAAAAAGQDGQEQILGGEPVRGTEAPAVAAPGAALDDRMPDMIASEADALEIGRLERQQCQQMIVPARHPPCPAGAPCPHHRRHVMNERHIIAAAPQALRDPPREAGAVDRHHGIGTQRRDRCHRLADMAQDHRRARKDLGNPGDRQIG